MHEVDAQNAFLRYVYLIDSNRSINCFDKCNANATLSLFPCHEKWLS